MSKIKIKPCLKCGGTHIKLNDLGYSTFNIGYGECYKCKNKVTGGCYGYPSKEELARIWNSGNDAKLLTTPISVSLKEDIVNVLEYFKRGLEDVEAGCGEKQPYLKEIRSCLRRLKKK